MTAEKMAHFVTFLKCIYNMPSLLPFLHTDLLQWYLAVFVTPSRWILGKCLDHKSSEDYKLWSFDTK